MLLQNKVRNTSLEQPANLQNPSDKPLWKRFFSGLKAYLTDWKNLLGHALLGVVFVVIAVWAPIPLWLKLIVIALLIGFNVFRMRRKGMKPVPEEEAAE